MARRTRVIDGRFLTVTLLIAMAAAAEAGTIQDESLDFWHQDLSQRNEFESVGSLILDGGGLCSGVMIGKQWVLTAAHCVAGANDVIFNIKGKNYQARRWFSHAGYDRTVIGNGRDIALIKLDERVPGVTPATVAKRGSDPRGGKITSVGFGLTGTGLTGGIPGSSGTRRAGYNKVEDIFFFQNRLGNRLIWYDFDAPENFGISDITDPDDFPITLEYAIAQGDSGGPDFNEDGDIVGIHSFGYGFGGILGFFRDILPGYNGASVSANAALHEKWIRKVMRLANTPGGGDFLRQIADVGKTGDPLPDLIASLQVRSNGTIMNAMAYIPEPGSVLLLAAGSLCLLRRRRPA